MKRLITFLLAVVIATQLHAQTPTLYYENSPSGYLNGKLVCGLWEPNLFGNCYAPAFFDWDGDGLKDLFFGTTDGRITYFKNTGTTQHPCFKRMTNNFGGIQVQYGYAAPFLCDLNGDLKTDFLVGNGISASNGGTVYYFKGTGTMDNPTFVLDTNMLASINLTDASVPFAVDVEGDGDLDLFIGEGYGGLYFRENTGLPQAPSWNSTTQLIADIGFRTSIQVLNIKGDARLEMIVAEAYGSLKLFNNISASADTAIWQQAPGNFANIDACASTGGCLVRPAFVDIDNNGTNDLFIHSEGKFYFYRNLGTPAEPNMVLEPTNFATLPNYYLYLHFADTDLDDKLEMYVPAIAGKVAVYENEGSPSEPDWALQTTDFLGFTTTYPKTLAFGDVNGDSLPDVLVGHFGNPMFSPKMMLFLNTGSGFVYQSVPFLETFAYGSNAMPELVDLDNDGLQDLVVATGSSTLLHFEATDASGLNWQQIPGADSPLPVSFTDIHKTTFGDFDEDGDIDLAATGSYYENTGCPAEPKFVKRNWSVTAGFGTYPTWVNLTDDCGLELFSGGKFYKYKGIQPQIQSYTYEYLCSNSPAKQFTALPENGDWLLGTNPQGLFNPDTLPGYFGVIYALSVPMGCHVRYDTVWVNVSQAPNAAIVAINGEPITGDTIKICPAAGIQALATEQAGGSFTGLNMGQGQFNPATWGMGYHTVTYQIYQNNCWDRDTIVIKVTAPPVATIAGDSVICPGKNATLTASGGTGFVWNTGATTADIAVNLFFTTTFNVTVTGEGIGCSDTESATIAVHSFPNAVILGSGGVCKGDSITLTAYGGVSFLWSDSSTTSSITVSPTVLTNYFVTITDENGCTDEEPTTVPVFPLPSVTISGDALICYDESTTLTASGDANFLWSNGDTTASINIHPTQTITFSVTTTDNNGCMGADSLTIVVNELPDATIATINSTPINGDTVFLCDTSGLQMLVPINPGGVFSGIPANGEFDPMALVLGSHPVIYTLTQNGCTDSSALTIVIQSCLTGTRSEKGAKFRFVAKPNPFSISITFEIELQHAGTLALVLTDMNGREVKKLLNGIVLTAGNHVFSFDDEVARLAEGAYMVTLWKDGRACSQMVVRE